MTITDQQDTRVLAVWYTRSLPPPLPCGEPASLTIVPVHGQDELGSDEHNVLVVKDDTAVVARSFVHHWPVRQREHKHHY